MLSTPQWNAYSQPFPLADLPRFDEESILDTTSLLSVCTIAFISVFSLLAFLACAIHIITALFPERTRAIDPAVIAAITTTVGTAIPGARVVHIEEKS